MFRQHHSQRYQGGHVVEDVRGKGGDIVVPDYPEKQLGLTRRHAPTASRRGTQRLFMHHPRYQWQMQRFLYDKKCDEVKLYVHTR